MSTLIQLPIRDDKFVIDRKILEFIGVTSDKINLRIVGRLLVISPEAVAPVDHEELIERIVARSGASREEVEHFLNSERSWGPEDAATPELYVAALRAEADLWSGPAW